MDSEDGGGGIVNPPWEGLRGILGRPNDGGSHLVSRVLAFAPFFAAARVNGWSIGLNSYGHLLVGPIGFIIYLSLLLERRRHKTFWVV